MFCVKKIKTHGNTGEDRGREIDFPWVYVVATSQLGISYREAGRMSFGRWLDMFEDFKRLYNFRAERKTYRTEEEEEEISTLDAL